MTYERMYDRIRLKLRQPERILDNATMRVLHESVADEITQERLPWLIRDHIVTLDPGATTISTSFAEIGTAAGSKIYELIGAYVSDIPQRIATYDAKQRFINTPYIVVVAQTIRGFAIPEATDMRFRFFIRYELTADGSDDELFNQYGSFSEYALTKQILEWQKAEPAELALPVANYQRALQAAKRNPNIVIGRLPQ